jgi:hypothetical protein
VDVAPYLGNYDMTSDNEDTKIHANAMEGYVEAAGDNLHFNIQFLFPLYCHISSQEYLEVCVCSSNEQIKFSELPIIPFSFSEAFRLRPSVPAGNLQAGTTNYITSTTELLY